MRLSCALPAKCRHSTSNWTSTASFQSLPIHYSLITKFKFPESANYFSILQKVQTGSRAHRVTQSTIFLRTSSFTLRSWQDTNLHIHQDMLPPQYASPSSNCSTAHARPNRTDTSCQSLCCVQTVHGKAREAGQFYGNGDETCKLNYISAGPRKLHSKRNKWNAKGGCTKTRWSGGNLKFNASNFFPSQTENCPAGGLSVRPSVCLSVQLSLVITGLNSSFRTDTTYVRLCWDKQTQTQTHTKCTRP